jgi:hypothetical protein
MLFGAMFLGLVFVLVVQTLLAVRLKELRRVGRALSAPRIFNPFNNLPVWAFLLGGAHKSIGDEAVTFYVWTLRLLVVGWLVLFIANFTT